ncbi:MAG: hypothetical protein MPW16_06830 [Candidatus Manganitrophus sp.]|nr:MAG: hypothetical protein MPW16_06830 [Candidatus Manganitrophus sp.]
MVLIGLEVLWTRMFALIFQNSVYSFSAILLTVLIGSPRGRSSSAECAEAARPMMFLGATLGLAAFSTLLIPFLFLKTTGITYFAYGAGWPSYLYR